MVTSEELNATFAKVGNDFHFDEVSAEFAPYRDLKVRWCRTMDSISFTVSDFLEGAIFRRISVSRTGSSSSIRPGMPRAITVPASGPARTGSRPRPLSGTPTTCS